MEIKSHSTQPDGKVFITLEIDPSVGITFFEQEQKLGGLLSEVGILGTRCLLERYDSDARILRVSDVKYYVKGVQKKSTKALMGA